LLPLPASLRQDRLYLTRPYSFLSRAITARAIIVVYPACSDSPAPSLSPRRTTAFVACKSPRCQQSSRSQPSGRSTHLRLGFLDVLVPLRISRYRNERVPHVEARTKCIARLAQDVRGLQGEPATAASQWTARSGRTTSTFHTVPGAQEFFPTQRQPEAPPTAAAVVTTTSSVSTGSLWRLDLILAYTARTVYTATSSLA
jgi:hypothetical protein